MTSSRGAVPETYLGSSTHLFHFTLATLLRLVAGAAVLFAVIRLSAPLGAIVAVLTLIIAAIPDPAWLRKRYRQVPWYCLGAFWFSQIIGPISALPYLLNLYLLARARFVALGLCFAFSPIGLSFLNGVLDYRVGRAHLSGHGPYEYRRNLHPVYRVPTRSSMNCCPWGHEWMFDVPYFFAVESMIQSFGYMEGSYTGPYPTDAEAIAALAEASAVPITDVYCGKVTVNGKSCQLDLSLSRVQLAQFLAVSPGPVKIALVEDRCLLLELPDPAPTPSSKSAIYLVDFANGRPFARYRNPPYWP